MPSAQSPCPICHGSSVAIIRLKGGFTARRCRACDVVFAEPMPTEAELEEYYAGWLFSLPPDDQFERWRKHTQAGVGEAVAKLNSCRSMPIATALDFGGGLGFFAGALTDHVREVHLYDMSAASRDYARSRFSPGVAVHDEAELALRAGPYDLILLNQVIEHVTDPVAFVRPLLAALAPDGVLVVTTPNNDMADALIRPNLFLGYLGNSAEGHAKGTYKLFTDSWLCLDPPRHLFAFNGGSLAGAMEKAGFRTIETFTRGWDTDPFGYPMYAAVPTSPLQKLSRTWREAGTAISRRLDARQRHGNTLIGLFGHRT